MGIHGSALIESGPGIREIKNKKIRRGVPLHEVTTQNAVTSYQKTKFSKTKGALAYYNKLKCHASHMVQFPDEYSMKRKFLGGLPDVLIKNLFKSHCVTMEHTPIDKLLHEVKAMESSIQAIQNYRSNRLATSKSHSSMTANVTNTQTSNVPLVWFVF